jgi:RNA polymerase sigma-70 factor (ECF subfamily)
MFVFIERIGIYAELTIIINDDKKILKFFVTFNFSYRPLIRNQKMGPKHIHQKLISRCKSGDTKAQFEIYKLYYKGMYNVSLRIVQDSQEAEDVMQEAFLSAFKNLDTWSQEVTFGSWLKRIVINKSLDYVKKRKMQISSIDEKEMDIEAENLEYDESVSLKVEEVKRAIMNLPEKYREVTVLFLFEGYTHNEIAEILEITAESSRVRFKRAKEMIVNAPGMKKVFQNLLMN